MADRLPGMTARARRGPMLRSVGTFSASLKKQGPVDAYTVLVIDAMRQVANSLDRLAVDADRSEHTVGTNAGRLAQLLELVKPVDTAGVDDVEAFRQAVTDAASAIRDTPTH